MRRTLILFLALAISGPAFGADNYTAKDSTGATVTFKSKDVGAGVEAVQSIPTDSTGALFGITGNPFFVKSNDGDLATIGTKADSTCGTANGTCSLVALIKFLNTQVQAAIPPGSNLIGSVSIDQTTPGTTNAVQSIPGIAAGLSTYFVQPAASDNHVNIKNGSGNVYKITATNNSATINYLRLYDAATGFNGCNSATNIKYQMAIPASTSGTGFVDQWNQGMQFSTGISICVTSGYATNDTTNATASAMSVNIGYK